MVQPQGHPSPAGPAPTSASIPFPVDRASSDLTAYLQLGKAAAASSAGASPSGDALHLDAGAGAAEYAVYRFNVPSAPDNVQVSLGGGTTAAWIGVANFTTQRWELSGPFTDNQIVALNATADISPLGNVCVAVLAPAGSSAVVDQLLLFAANVPPVAAFYNNPGVGYVGIGEEFDGMLSTDPDGSIVHYEWDFDNDGQFEVDRGAQSRVYHTFTAPGSYPVTLRVTDSGGAQDTESRTLDVQILNHQPVAKLIVTPNAGSAPLDVTLDASASSDPDGPIAHYQWDLDGDGTFETDGGAVATYAPAPTPFTIPGSYSVGVRVTDGQGAAATATASLTVHGWRMVNADLPGNGGDYSSLAIVNGHPAIAYLGFAGPAQLLKYAYSSTADGSSSWTALTVDDGAGDLTGFFDSLAVVNGKPAISYCDVSTGALRYASSSALDGSSSWTAFTLPTGGDHCQFTSLAEVDALPALAFYDSSSGHQQYAYSTASDGSTAWSIVTVDNGATQTGSGGCSLAVVAGFPAISFADNTQGLLRLARSSQVDGSSGWTEVTVDSGTSNLGCYSSLAVVNGFPAISYADAPAQSLKYAFSTLADGSGGWTSLTLDSSALQVGQYTSLAVINGTPAIAYFDFSNTNLKFASSTAADGSGGWSNGDLDDSGYVGEHPSLQLVDGRAAVSYFNHDSSTLEYAVLY